MTATIHPFPVPTDPDPEPPPFDRAAHCRRIAQSGGFTTAERYGDAYMAMIGKRGFAVTKDVLGTAQAVALIRGKGWRRPQQLPLFGDRIAA
jgi:hypothetical protein